MMAKICSTHHSFNCIVLFAVNEKGEVDPTRSLGIYIMTSFFEEERVARFISLTTLVFDSKATKKESTPSADASFWCSSDCINLI